MTKKIKLINTKKKLYGRLKLFFQAAGSIGESDLSLGLVWLPRNYHKTIAGIKYVNFSLNTMT